MRFLCIGLASFLMGSGMFLGVPVARAEEKDPQRPPTVLTATLVAQPAGLEALAHIAARPVVRGGSRARLLRTGFRPGSDGGEVLLQTSADVVLETAPPRKTGGLVKDGGDNETQATFVLRGCRVVRRTDRLPLETRFFNASVTRVSVIQRGADLRIVVALRAPVTAVPRKEAGPRGTWTWVLRFPAAATASASAPVRLLAASALP